MQFSQLATIFHPNQIQSRVRDTTAAKLRHAIRVRVLPIRARYGSSQHPLAPCREQSADTVRLAAIFWYS